MNIERKLSRREFLIGAGLAIIAAGCKRAEEKLPVVVMEPSITLEPTQLPTERPTAAPTPKPTDTLQPTAVPTPEATPTPEPKRISATTITQEYLKSAFAGIGGGEMVEGEKEEMSMMEFGQKYVNDAWGAWGEGIDFRLLPESPIASLKYLVSLGSYRGEEGIFSPGKQGEEVIFPQLADLSLARLTLKNVPPEADQKSQEYQEGVAPLNFPLRPGTQMTVVGEFKAREEAEFNYALVAFTDYLRASEESGVPRHYLVVLPIDFPADPDNKNTLSLANLLETNGYQYDSQNKEIVTTDSDGRKTILDLNQIEGEELNKEIKRAIGLYFVDQIKGELIKDPVVPYPPQREDYKLPRYWEARKGEDEEGNVVIRLFGSDSLDQEPEELVYLAQYMRRPLVEEERWDWWTRIIQPTPVPEEAWSPEDRKFYEDITRVFAFEKSPKVQSLIIGELERAKTIDPQKSGLEADRHYLCYTSAASFMKGIYYASGDSPQKRNKEMLKLLAQVRELARQNPTFDESNWVIEGVDSY